MDLDLPEKDFYSLDEIRERWGCSEELLYHYIFETNILRISFKFSEFLSFLRGEALVSEGDGHSVGVKNCLFPLRAWGGVDKYVTDKNTEHVSHQKYFYLHEPKIFDSIIQLLGDSQNTRVPVEDIDGNRFHLEVFEAADPPTFAEGMPLNYSEQSSGFFGAAVIVNSSTYYIQPDDEDEFHSWTWDIDRFFITREERDRFEAEHERCEIVHPYDIAVHEATEGILTSGKTHYKKAIDMAAANEATEDSLGRDAEGKSWTDESDYWQGLKSKAERAITEFPAWRKKQHKIRKTGNLQGWLTKTIGVDEREAESVKKALADFFEELR